MSQVGKAEVVRERHIKKERTLKKKVLLGYISPFHETKTLKQAMEDRAKNLRLYKNQPNVERL